MEFFYLVDNCVFLEMEQYVVYKVVVEVFLVELVVICMLDLGGDKLMMGNLDLFLEEFNLFFGFCVIWFCLEYREIFKDQFCVILWVSVYGCVKFMYLMISGLEELQCVNVVLEECCVELCKGGIVFDEKMGVGVMIEILSVVIMVDIFVKQCDFFSIGINDFI